MSRDAMIASEPEIWPDSTESPTVTSALAPNAASVTPPEAKIKSDVLIELPEITLTPPPDTKLQSVAVELFNVPAPNCPPWGAPFLISTKDPPIIVGAAVMMLTLPP